MRYAIFKNVHFVGILATDRKIDIGGQQRGRPCYYTIGSREKTLGSDLNYLLFM